MQQSQATKPAESADDTGTPILVQPRDPLIFRDARPFAAEPGARAFSMTWPLPRTVAGAVRTHLINESNASNADWSTKEAATRARQIRVHGPLMVARFSRELQWQPFVPAPADLVTFRELIEEGSETKSADRLSFLQLVPGSEAESELCDLPRKTEPHAPAFDHVALRPLNINADVKPESEVPTWWSLSDAAKWAMNIDRDDESVRQALPVIERKGKEYLRGMHDTPSEERIHVSINPDTQTSREGALFATEARAFTDGFADVFHKPARDSEPNQDSDPDPARGILCNVSGAEASDINPSFLPLGGERRLAAIETDRQLAPWPEPVYPTSDQLKQAKGLRLQLVTPAIFTHGWLPGWMADGAPPGLGGMKLHLTLVGAATGRRVPVSGWRLAVNPGPRATVYAVPAGSVYFFECSAPVSLEQWRKLWLQPISDLGLHRDEGFGLVLPGLW